MNIDWTNDDDSWAAQRERRRGTYVVGTRELTGDWQHVAECSTCGGTVYLRDETYQLVAQGEGDVAVFCGKPNLPQNPNRLVPPGNPSARCYLRFMRGPG